MKNTAIISFLVFFGIVLCLPFNLASSYPKAIIFSLIGSVLYLLFFDVIFRLLVRARCGSPYTMHKKVPFNRIYMEPHPYFPYAYKKNFIAQKEQPTNYPLNKDKGYLLKELQTNNLRHINGITGGRNVVIPKPKGLFRINCLGASTTGNYIFEGEKGFSYPLELERILQKRFQQKKIEVNNCGMGGFTTAEVLIKFILDTINSKPDMIVLYHAYNDLGPSLTPDFESDYFHAKKNLGETYHLFKWASRFPDIPLALPNYIFNLYFPQNIRHSLLAAVSKGTIDLKSEFHGLDTYRRNIENLIHICNGNGIKVILSTFCHFLYPDIKNDNLHLKYRKGLLEENKVMRELSAKYDFPLVDNFNLVPIEEKYFVDSIHFSPEGMQEIATNISKPIIEHIRSIS
jgi:lysophospholipase L1-like esterase